MVQKMDQWHDSIDTLMLFFPSPQPMGIFSILEEQHTFPKAASYDLGKSPSLLQPKGGKREEAEAPLSWRVMLATVCAAPLAKLEHALSKVRHEAKPSARMDHIKLPWLLTYSSTRKSTLLVQITMALLPYRSTAARHWLCHTEMCISKVLFSNI